MFKALIQSIQSIQSIHKTQGDHGHLNAYINKANTSQSRAVVKNIRPKDKKTKKLKDQKTKRLDVNFLEMT